MPKPPAISDAEWDVMQVAWAAAPQPVTASEVVEKLAGRKGWNPKTVRTLLNRLMNKGALAVDAIITNQAPFPQPYPSLQLQFTDLNGAPVAGRQFRPEEYLGGELTGSRLMPVQQPVHIALELVDPGPRAVNYLLTVVANSAEPAVNP